MERGVELFSQGDSRWEVSQLLFADDLELVTDTGKKYGEIVNNI